MRLTTVIILLTVFQLSAAITFGQKLTYNKRNTTINQLFKEIKYQTGYNVVWYEGKLNSHMLIDANFNNTPLEKVMDNVLAGRAVTYEIIGKAIVIKIGEPSFRDKVISFLASIDVHGTVLDENNEPLVGAIVKVKGGTNSVATNPKGEFTLKNVDENAILTISFLGYETQEVKASKKIAPIKLTPSTDKLEEVEINAGYYTVTDRERTGNITKITSATIEKQPVLNPLQALQNRVPGMQITQTTGVPGGGLIVQIRGRNSINTAVDNDPLYIVNDVIYPSTRITSNLGTGVLGSFGGSPLSAINPNDIESIEILKDADATAIYGSRGANGVVLIKTKSAKNGILKVGASFRQGLSEVDRRLEMLNTEEYLEMRKEAYFTNDKLTTTSTPYATLYDINGTWDPNQYIDWQKDLIGGTANNSNASLNVSGGSENANYIISGSYYKEGTVFPGDFNFSRKAINSNLNLGSMKEKLNVDFSMNFSNSSNKLPRDDITQRINQAPNAPNPFDENGQLNWANNTVFFNPMAQLLSRNDITINTLIGNIILSYKLNKDLTFKTSGGYNILQTDDIRKTTLIGLRPASNPTAANRGSSFYNGSIASWSVEPQLNYNTTVLNGKLRALIGMSFQESISQSSILSASNFPNDDLLENLSAAGTVTASNSQYSQYRYSAIFTRLNYSLLDKYFLNLTARRDGSSRFGNDRQFANFGAVGAAWLFSEESIIKNRLSFLDLGKLRASYGITGNDQIGDYRYLSLWSNGPTYQDNPTFFPSIANADYAWETNHKLEIAMQLGLFKNRLNVEFSWYRNRSSNQLIGDQLPLSTGSSTVTANRPATVQNTGWEIVTDFQILKKQNLQWSIGVNLTIPRNKLISYPGIENTSDAFVYIVGKPLSILRTYNLKGVNSQTGLYDIEDKDGNGILNNNDRYLYKFIGQYFYGGLNNSIVFHRFNFSFLLSFNKQNGNNYMSTIGRTPGNDDAGRGVSNQPTYVLKRWRQPNDQSSVQKFTTISSSQTLYNTAKTIGGLSITDASYIRLKNMSLSYSLPSNWLSKIHVNTLSLSISGQNIFTLSNYEGLDPETQSMTTLPPLRTLTIGMNLTL